MVGVANLQSQQWIMVRRAERIGRIKITDLSRSFKFRIVIQEDRLIVVLMRHLPPLQPFLLSKLPKRGSSEPDFARRNHRVALGPK